MASRNPLAHILERTMETEREDEILEGEGRDDLPLEPTFEQRALRRVGSQR